MSDQNPRPATAHTPATTHTPAVSPHNHAVPTPQPATPAPLRHDEQQLHPVLPPPTWPTGPVAVHLQTAPTSNTASPTASLVLGILALLTCWIPILGIVAWLLAPLGLLFGLLGLSTPGGRTLATVGAILSGIALLVCFAWLAALTA